MSNFVPTCVSYVKKSKHADKAVGYLIKVTQKESKDDGNGETDDVGYGLVSALSTSLEFVCTIENSRTTCVFIVIKS